MIFYEILHTTKRMFHSTNSQRIAVFTVACLRATISNAHLRPTHSNFHCCAVMLFPLMIWNTIGILPWRVHDIFLGKEITEDLFGDCQPKKQSSSQQSTSYNVGQISGLLSQKTHNRLWQEWILIKQTGGCVSLFSIQ